ncbi:MAG: DUF6687 family protein [Planctomycetota bacterium]
MLPVRLVTAPGGLPAGARVVAVDGSWPESVEPRRTGGLHLAHWPGNDTPADLKRDLSTEIAFAFLDLAETDRATRIQGCEALVLNHYDTDGVCAMLALSRPEVALPHRDRLIEVAASGDLFEVRSERAFAIDAALRNLADPARSGRTFARDAAGRQALLEAALDLLALLLEDDAAAPELWRDDVRALSADRDDLDAALHDDLVYMDLGVWTAPTERVSSRAGAGAAFDPGRHALLASGRHDRALVLGPGAAGTTARLVLGTRSFFDLVSREPSARPDLPALAERLASLEGRREDGAAWRFQDPTGASPELWFGADELPLYAEHAGAALAPSRIEANEIKRMVLDAVRDAWVLPDDDDEADDGEDIFAV